MEFNYRRVAVNIRLAIRNTDGFCSICIVVLISLRKYIHPRIEPAPLLFDNDTNLRFKCVVMHAMITFKRGKTRKY